MTTFISFNFLSGFCAAMVAASQLESHGEDCWWFPEPMEPAQLDDAVDTALANSNRCLLIWSKAELTPWQFFEICRIRDHLAKRTPAGDPTDMFIILRNVGDTDIKSESTLPMFSHCEYIDYCDELGANGKRLSNECPHVWGKNDAPECLSNSPFHCEFSENIKLPDLSYFTGFAPSITPLTYSGDKKPIFNRKIGFKPAQGRHVLIGEYQYGQNNESGLTLNCWIFLEDLWGKLYVQQPRPTITHAFRWLATNIHLGPNIKTIILAGLGPCSNRIMINKVLRKEWGSIEQDTLPNDFLIIDKIECQLT